MEIQRDHPTGEGGGPILMVVPVGDLRHHGLVQY